MKSMHVILNTILSKNIFEYITVDKELNVINVSDSVDKYLGETPKKNDDILGYLPELVGNEEEIQEIFIKGYCLFSLETVYKNDFYINITIEYCDQNTAIILLQNITDTAHSNQKLLQCSNDATLLNNTLQKVTNEQNILIVQQSKLAIMGEMINNIAHQWRQPLNRINSNVAVINEIFSSKQIDRKMLKANIKNIKKNTKYMSNTIEDFITFFHPEKKKVHFTMHDTINEVLELIQTRLNGIDIVITAEEILSIVSFKNEFYQVLLSILNNAIDNFKIKKIENPRIEIIIQSNTKMALIGIQDNGGGIERKDINQIFEPYYTTKFTHGGTGLGLYISKMIVERSMGGYLSVKNIKNGTCFEIKIPKEKE